MVQGDGQISEAGPAAFADGSMDIARIHTRPSPPPLHRLGA
jgi:hypothetical protein